MATRGSIMARAISRSRRLLLCGALLLACEGTRAGAPPSAPATRDPAAGAPAALPEEDGYDLWLRYRQVTDAERLAQYRAAAQAVVTLDAQGTIRADIAE